MSELVEVGFTWDGVSIPAGERVHFTLDQTRNGLQIDVDAPFHGDPPPDSGPGHLDGLWAHEVVELFLVGLAPPGAPRPYLEIELGPHGHHLVIELLGVRQRVRLREDLVYEAEILGHRWVGSAFVPSQWLPTRIATFNAYSIHGTEPRRYLAMTPVPGAMPDFHRLDPFSRWMF